MRFLEVVYYHIEVTVISIIVIFSIIVGYIYINTKLRLIFRKIDYLMKLNKRIISISKELTNIKKRNRTK